MDTQEKMKLLADVMKAVAEEPGLFSEIVNACQYGINKKIELANQRAADFETVAVAFNAMHSQKRTSPQMLDWVSRIIISKFEKWEGKTAMNWDKLTNALNAYNE